MSLIFNLQCSSSESHIKSIYAFRQVAISISEAVIWVFHAWKQQLYSQVLVLQLSYYLADCSSRMACCVTTIQQPSPHPKWSVPTLSNPLQVQRANTQQRFSSAACKHLATLPKCSVQTLSNPLQVQRANIQQPSPSVACKHLATLPKFSVQPLSNPSQVPLSGAYKHLATLLRCSVHTLSNASQVQRANTQQPFSIAAYIHLATRLNCCVQTLSNPSQLPKCSVQIIDPPPEGIFHCVQYFGHRNSFISFHFPQKTKTIVYFQINDMVTDQPGYLSCQGNCLLTIARQGNGIGVYFRKQFYKINMFCVYHAKNICLLRDRLICQIG